MHARHTRKKVRGLRRKCSAMIKGIEEYTKEFPQKNDRDYWHLHLPVAKAFIDSLKTPRSVRRLCIQTLIEQTNHLINIRQDEGTFTRIVGAINLPELWDSQIIVFLVRITMIPFVKDILKNKDGHHYHLPVDLELSGV